MAKEDDLRKDEKDLKKLVLKLSKIGVTATVTKSRLELLKVLAPPKTTSQF